MLNKSVFKSLVFFTLLFFVSVNSVLAQDTNCRAPDTKDPAKLQEIINACSSKLEVLSKQRTTLSDQINYMDTQINLTQLEINSNSEKQILLQKEIDNLGNRIGELEVNLSQISEMVNRKISAIYKQQKVPALSYVFFADNLPSFLRSIQYLKKTQENDRQILIRTQNKKLNFKEQKGLREQKEEELRQITTKLESYKINLGYQQQEKENLLQITQNDEKTYQNILNQARAEYLAIKAIVAGSGTESKVKDVTKGETIANLILGPSCNSGGTHLHFIVKDGSSTTNPFNYLKSVDSENCSGSSCGSGDGDSFNPSGSWDWPLNPRISLTQGFGSTWAVLHSWVGSIYSFHDGIDFTGSGTNVMAVNDGELYKGSYGCVPYARVAHKDSQISTYYLHVY